MTDPSLPRVRWRERQRLRSTDLEAEQSYRLDAGRRHLREHHGPGVVRGLELSNDGGGGVAISPGVAVDAAGGSIVLPRPLRLSGATLDAAFERLGGDRLVVSVARVEERTGAPRAGRDCFTGDRQRWRETIRLQLCAPPHDGSTPTHAAAADGGTASAPVALGSIERQAHSATRTDRLEAGLVARQVVDPAGRAQLALHEEPLPKRATVSVGDGAGTLTERLTIDRQRATSLGASTAAGGRVVLRGEGPSASQRVRFGELAATPGEARAWSLYRTRFQATADDATPSGPARRQLRIELGAPGEDGDPANHRFAIGRRLNDRFVPLLSADARCTLRVQALDVLGQVVESAIPADPTDPRFAAAAAANYLSGISATLGQLGAISVSTSLESATVEPGDDLTFGVEVSNVGLTSLQNVRVTARLIPEGGSASAVSLLVVPTLAGSDRESAEGLYETLAAGSYSLVVSAVATAPGLTPVTATEITRVTAQPLIL